MVVDGNAGSGDQRKLSAQEQELLEKQEFFDHLHTLLAEEVSGSLISEILSKVASDSKYGHLLDSEEFPPGWREQVRGTITERLNSRHAAITSTFNTLASSISALMTGVPEPAYTPFSTAFDYFMAIMKAADLPLADHDAYVQAGIALSQGKILDIRGSIENEAKSVRALPRDESVSLLAKSLGCSSIEDLESRLSRNQIKFELFKDTLALNLSHGLSINALVKEHSERLGISPFEFLELSQYHHYFIERSGAKIPKRYAQFRKDHEAVALPQAGIYTFAPSTGGPLSDPGLPGALAIATRIKTWERIAIKSLRQKYSDDVINEYMSRNRHVNRPEAHELMSDDYRDEVLDIIHALYWVDGSEARAILNTVSDFPGMSSLDSWGMKVIVPSENVIAQLLPAFAKNYLDNHGVPHTDEKWAEQQHTFGLMRRAPEGKNLIESGPFQGLYVTRYHDSSQVRKKRHFKIAFSIPVQGDADYPFEAHFVTPAKALVADYLDPLTRHINYQKDRARETHSISEIVGFADAYRLIQSVLPSQNRI